MIFYEETSKLFVDTLDYIEHHNFYLVYGNAIKFYDELPSEYINRYAKNPPSTRLAAHIVNQRRWLFKFMGQNSTVAEQMFFADMCANLELINDGYKSLKAKCKLSMDTKNGLTGYLQMLTDSLT